MSGSLKEASHFDQLRAGWDLLIRSERRHAWLIGIAVFISSVIDLLAVSSIVPLLGLVVAPDAWVRRPLFTRIMVWLGEPDLKLAIPALAIAIVALLLISAGGNVLIRHIINSYSSTCRKRLAHDIASACATAPLIWYLDRNAAVISRQINMDIMRWGGDFITRVFSVIQTLVLASLAMTIILTLAPLAGIVSGVVTIGLIFGISRLTRIRLSRYINLERSKQDSTAVTLLQLLSGIKDVKLSSRGGYFVQLFHEAFALICDNQAKRNTIRQVLPVLFLMGGQCALIIVVVFLWTTGESPARIAEQTILLALIASRLVPAVNRFFADLDVLWDMYPYIKGITELRDSLAVAIRRDRGSGSNRVPDRWDWDVIEFLNVGMVYPGAARPSLEGINFRFNKGKTYGIAGPSGAGKTTLADIFLGLLRPNSGEIRAGEFSLSEVDSAAWYRHIGYVSQNPFITDDTLRANIAFGVPASAIDDSLVQECMRLANLGDLEAELPEGLFARLGDRGTKISGGQRQRIAIARALYKQPDILVMDEATSALDNISEAAVQDAVRNLQGRVTIVIIAHRLSTIQWCDQIILLSEGRLEDTGTFSELEARNALFKEMVALGKSDDRPVKQQG